MNMDDEHRDKALLLSSRLSGAYDEEKTEEFAKEHTQRTWYHDFRLLFDMIRDKEYGLDPKSYLVVAGALAYVVFPVDVIPDMILGVGFLDDAFVIGMVIDQLTDEIARYKLYRGMKGSQTKRDHKRSDVSK